MFLRTILNNSKIILYTLLILVFFSCTSNSETPGPFTKYTLIQNGLISEDVQHNTKTRIIYPIAAQEEDIRTLIDLYINKHPDIQEFVALGDDVSSTREQTQYNGLHTLGIYCYEIVNRNNIISIVIEAAYNVPEELHFSNWYTINFNTHKNQLFSYNYLFEEKQEVALKSISNFVKQDLKRQKQLRNIDIENDPFIKMDKELYHNLLYEFVLIPSIEKKDSFSGIRVYLNKAGDISEGKYAVNIPANVFKRFLGNDLKDKFVEEHMPLIIEKPSRLRIATFPDLSEEF